MYFDLYFEADYSRLHRSFNYVDFFYHQANNLHLRANVHYKEFFFSAGILQLKKARMHKKMAKSLTLSVQMLYNQKKVPFFASKLHATGLNRFLDAFRVLT